MVKQYEEDGGRVAGVNMIEVTPTVASTTLVSFTSMYIQHWLMQIHNLYISSVALLSSY